MISRISPSAWENAFRFAMLFLLASILAVLLYINTKIPDYIEQREFERTEESDG